MNYDHSISSTGSDAAALPVPQFDVNEAPPPPPPPPTKLTAPPTKLTADFAASAAMAKDILALSADDEGAVTLPPQPPSAGETQEPRPVPDLDVPSWPGEWAGAAPMAADFFFTSSESKAKKRLWKISR